MKNTKFVTFANSRHTALCSAVKNTIAVFIDEPHPDWCDPKLDDALADILLNVGERLRGMGFTVCDPVIEVKDATECGDFGCRNRPNCPFCVHVERTNE